MSKISQSNSVIIRTLGNMAVYQSGQLVTDFISRKSELVFIYLVAHPGVQERETIANLFWDSGTKTSVLNNLSKALTNIRQLFPDCVVATRNTVSIELESHVDFLELEQHYHHLIKTHGDYGELSSHDVQTIAEFLQEYSGEFLPGVDLQNASDFEEWLLYKRTTIRHQQLSVMHELGQYYLYSGQYEKGLVWAQRQLELDPYWEDALQQLVYLLVGLKRYADARRQFDVFAHRLDAELGVEPNTDLQSLYEQVCAKQVELPEIHYIHNNLPEFHSNTVQRPQMQRQIAEWMGDNSNRLLSLVGLGGSGKSRLAIYTAKQHLRDFPDGVYFVTFEEDENLEECAQRIARTIGLRLKMGQESTIQVAQALTDRQVLLILDSLEMINEACELVTTLLKNTRMTQIMVTSRKSMGISGERILPVRGMTFANGNDNIGAMSEALQLLAQCTPNTTIDFSLEENRKAAHKICHIVGSLPLALELVAQWLSSISLQQIAQYLEEQPHILTDDASALGDQLEDVFTYTFNLLTDEQLARFAALAVYVGGFQIDIVLKSKMASLGDFATFVNMALIFKMAPDRYAMHPVIRHLALAKAEDRGTLEAAYITHAQVYTQYAHEVLELFRTEHELAAYQSLANEYDNFVQALKTTQTQKLVDLAIPMIAVFARVLRTNKLALNSILPYLPLLDEIELTEHSQYIEALANVGRVLSDMGDVARGEQYVQRALALSYRAEDNQTIAHRLIDMTSIALRGSDPQQMLVYLEEALQVSQQIHDNRLIALVKGTLGAAHAMMNNLDKAYPLMIEALETSKLANSIIIQVQMLAYIGTINVQKRNYEEAIAYAQHSLELGRKYDYYPYYSQNLNTLIMAYKSLEDYDAASQTCQQLIQYARQIGFHEHIAMGLYRMGNIKLKQQEFVACYPYYEEALPMFLARSTPIFAAYTLIEMIVALIELKDYTTSALFMGMIHSVLARVSQPLSTPSQEKWDEIQLELKHALEEKELRCLIEEGRVLPLDKVTEWLPSIRDRSKQLP